MLTTLNPLAAFAMLPPGQTDCMGRPVLNLHQLALPGVVEHDSALMVAPLACWFEIPPSLEPTT